MKGRIVVGVIGLDQHEVAALAIARLLTRHGFEVIYLGRFQTPQSVIAAAVNEDAQVVGVSCHSWEYTSFAPVLAALAKQEGIAAVLGGSVITDEDAVRLREAGIDAVFGPLATEAQIIDKITMLVARAEEPEKTAGTLTGRVVAITGAGRGLGRAYAIHLASLGASVVANDLDEVADEDGIVAHVGDISTEGGAADLIATALTRFGRLDALVNNAGILRSGLLLRLSAQEWDDVHRVHLRGTFLTTRAAGAYWREQAKEAHPVQAALVNTTSAAGLYGFLGEAAYSAAKGGIASFTLVAAAELARYGVTVNAIAPAARTRLIAVWAGEGPGDPALDPLAPEHVAPLIAWLVGPGSRDVTGRVFEVGNGSLAVVDGWRPGAHVDLPMSGYKPDALVRPLLAKAPEPVPVLSPERL